jgi:DNA replication protein DnaC
MAEVMDQVVASLSIDPQTAHELVERLLDAQLADNTERLIERRLREAHLPERKTLLDFDFSFQVDLDRRLVQELASCRFIEKRQGVIFAGNSGTGKSHMAIALAVEACKRGLSVLYTTAAAMLSELYSGLADNSLELKLKRYLPPTLLLIDELGFDRLEQENARNAALFFKVVDGRYQRASTIYTTNIDFEALGHYLGDPVVTTAIVDRMIHRSTVITLSGPSWRLKQSRELNKRVREQPPPDPPPPAAAPVPPPTRPASRAKTRSARDAS